MGGYVSTGLRGAVAKAAVAAAFAAAGTAVFPSVAAAAAPGVLAEVRTPVPLDDAPTGPNDPKCIQMPLDPICQGGPYYQGAPPPQVPTNPLDPAYAEGVHGHLPLRRPGLDQR